MGCHSSKKKSEIYRPSNSALESSASISNPPTLLAWCSHKNNQISVIDLKKNKNNVTFDGAKISDTSNMRFSNCLLSYVNF